MADRLQLGITITADGKAAEAALGRVKTSMGQVKTAAVDLSSAANLAKSAFASLGVALSTRELLRTADAYASMQARLKLVSGTSQEFLTAQTRLFQIAQQNLAPLGETVTLYTKLSTSIRDMGKSQADALEVTDLVAKTLRLSGASAQESAAALLQFGQALGSGVLQGDELRSILESSPRLARALAEGLGVATGQLKAMGAAGELSSRKVVEALQSQAATIKAEYTTMPLTVSGAWQQMENAATQYIGKTDQAAGSSRKLAEALSLVANNLEAIADPLATVVGTITKIEVGGWLQFRDILDSIKTNLKEMVGLKDAGAVDPEVQRLVKLGQGQIPINELAAGQQAQTQYFDGVKRGANDAALAMTKLSDKQKEIAALVIETAKANKVDPAWALAIAQQESGFNQLAKSAAGAQGVMQLMPGTAKQLGVNINDVNDNIKGGVLYLKQQQEQFKSLKLASAAYNAGPGNVTKFGGVPPFKETQNYVQSVAALYQQWQQVLGAQGTAFASAKDQADELKTAFESLKTHQDGMVSAVENFAKVQVEKIKTSLTALEAERKATQDLTTAQLASAKTYDDKQRLLAEAAQQQDQYNQKAIALAQQELSAQQSVIEARKQALTTELANADRYNLTIIEQAKLKQGIAAADADLSALAEQRARVEIEAGAKVNEASRQAMALKQQEQDAIGGIIAEYERQVEVLNRLTQAQQAGASAEQLGFLSQYYGQSGQLPEVVSAEQLQRMQQYQLSTLAVKDAIQEMTKATQDQAKAEQSVREEQLRQNAFWDQFIGRINDYANTWKQISGDTNDAFANMTVAAFNYAKQVEQISQLYRDLNGQPTTLADSLGDMAPAMEGIQQLEASLNLVARSLLTIRDQYEEGSKQYQNYQHAAAGVAVAAQAAALAEGILAVVHQLSSGDPYSAIPRALAVSAMLASMGIQSGASGGGSSASARTVQQSTGTGTVLGDSSAQSLSISKSIDLIASNTSSDLSYSARMLQALQNIESALSGASSLIFQSVIPSIKDSIANSGLDLGMKKISLFSGFDKEVTDAGLGQVAAQSLQSILKDGFKTLAKYADITDSFKVLGMELSSSTKTYIRDLDAGVTGQFNRVIKGMVDALKEGSTAFGLSGDEFSARLAKFKVDIGKISLKDLSSEEAKKQIEAAFSKVFDEMASTLAVGLRPFKRGGEGAAETFFRVAEGIQRATGELAQIGIQAINYRDILAKQGDVYTEIVRQSVAAQGRLVAGTQAMVAEFNAAQGDIKDFYLNLVKAQDLLAAGFNVQNLDRTMINAAGGLDAFVSAMQSFNDAYLSQADNIAGQLSSLSAQFAQFGQTLPESKDAFLALMQSIDTSTEAGKKLFGGLLQLADGFAKVNDQIDQIRQKYADKLDPMAAIRKTIEGVGTDFSTLLADAATKIQSNVDAESKDLKARQATIDADLERYNNYADSVAKSNNELQDKITKWMQHPKANADKIAKAKATIEENNRYISDMYEHIVSKSEEWYSIQKQLDEINAKGEAEKLAARKPILENAAAIMTETLADIMQGLAQTIQEAQQRLDNVLSFQRNLVTQIAQLQGSQAIADLANARYGQADTAVHDYIGAVNAGSRARDTEEEIKLLGNLQTAVMDRYSAEMALIQESVQQQADALNEALQVEIDAINAATQARIEAVNTELEAEITAIQAAADAQIKAQQKADQEAIKAIQKQNDAAIKAAQKANDVIIKAQQKANDAVIKSQQKIYDAQIKVQQKVHDQQIKSLQKQQDAELKVWSDQLDAANKLRDAIKGIQEYARSLALGPQSTLSPEARLAEAQRQYQDLLAKAQGGDADAIAKLSGSSDAYLEAAKQYFGSGSQYQSIFEGVQAAMSGLGAMSAPDPDSIQSHIDALREAQSDRLDALREAQSEQLDLMREQQGEQLDILREQQGEQLDLMREQQAELIDVLREQQGDAIDAIREAQADNIDAMRKATQDQIDAARKSAQSQIDAIQKAAQDQIKEAQTRTAQAIKDLSDPNKNAAMKALKDETIAKLQEIHDLSEATREKAAQDLKSAQETAARQAAEAIQIARDQLARLNDGLTFSEAQLLALNGIMKGLGINYQVAVPGLRPLEHIEPAANPDIPGLDFATQIPRHAAGGYAQSGMALVGEQGPELIRFERPAQVLTAEQTRQALSGDDQGKITAAIGRLEKHMEAGVRVQSTAMPLMIEELRHLRERVDQMERQQRIKA